MGCLPPKCGCGRRYQSLTHDLFDILWKMGLLLMVSDLVPDEKSGVRTLFDVVRRPGVV